MNRPKPSKLKILDGNPGKRQINLFEPEPKKARPSMPKWLKEYPVAVKEWKREIKILDDMGIMTVAEEGNLAMRCYLAGQIQDLAKNKDTKELNKIKNLITEYRQIGSLLGLDAPSRTKFKTDKPKHKSKAEAFRAQKNGAK